MYLPIYRTWKTLLFINIYFNIYYKKVYFLYVVYSKINWSVLDVENGTTTIPRDYFLGCLDARKQYAIQNKYSRIEEVRFCDLSTGSESILNLMMK